VDPNLAARKTLEEAGELAFAAKDTATGASDQRVVEEAADLMYHLLVLLAQQEVDPQRVADELVSRAH
jgi:phosphoribosyl-ATP pyrophosphohydrolase